MFILAAVASAKRANAQIAAMGLLGETAFSTLFSVPFALAASEAGQTLSLLRYPRFQPSAPGAFKRVCII
jgi:hypothetical protein